LRPTQAISPLDCAAQREDYFECLHHRKEFTRLNAIQQAKEARAKEAPRQPRNPASVQF